MRVTVTVKNVTGQGGARTESVPSPCRVRPSVTKKLCGVCNAQGFLAGMFSGATICPACDGMRYTKIVDDRLAARLIPYLKNKRVLEVNNFAALGSALLVSSATLFFTYLFYTWIEALSRLL